MRSMRNPSIARQLQRTLDSRSEIFRPQAGVASDSCEHARADFVGIMKGEHEVRVAVACQDFVRSSFALELPTDSEECGEYSPGLRGGPRTHLA